MASRAAIGAYIEAVRGGGMAALAAAALACYVDAGLRAARPDIEAALRDTLRVQARRPMPSLYRGA
ncbi:hypothetical protein [Roseateles saccharophilus]|uniref:Uncharacterized protein n=1 Tax=Roseateles saccharophilus TaxID=304 RepID=A0A4R3UL17_ROSSA|nr:hypothetical protein [Roseateles saccharophilus]MDG0833926.1 hypothetical protein [Roseateles saccharophilus]TCU91130.1 hypothetical protein EV671_102761 [Roseateles saccharophilus]